MTLYKKADLLSYPGNGANIITVQSNDVSRVNTYWDIMLSLGINYKFNRRFSLNVEPQLRSSISSVYTGSNTSIKNPYSVGLRTGILYKL